MVRSKFENVDVPDVPVQSTIFAKCEDLKDRQILVDGLTGKSYNFAEVKQLALNIAAALRDKGFKKGDVLIIVCENCLEFPLMIYGCMFLGVVVTTANPLHTVYELKYQIKDSGAVSILTSDDLAPKLKEAAEETTQIREIFVTGSAPGFTPFQHLIDWSGPEFDPLSVKFDPAEDLVFLPYSSGTTGLPKGVLMTHRNVVSGLMQIFADPFRNPNRGSSVQARTLGMLPFYHAYGLLVVLVRAVMVGSMIVIIPKFTPETFLETIEKYKITSLSLVPPLILFLTKNPMVKNYDLSSVRKIGSGGAPLTADVEIELAQVLKNAARIRQAYGLTETTPIALAHPYANPKPGSVGVILPNTEVKIVDKDTGKVLGPNQHGELWIRGPQVTVKGYRNRPEDTQNTFDAEGWLHTGDVGYYDEEEYFYVVDRIKEFLKVKGFQVAPAELEALLLTHPAIYDAGVTSIPDERAGELPMAYIVKQPNAVITDEEVHEYVAERAAPYKQLKGGIEFVDEIPKLASGKILRRVLKERAAKRVEKN